MSSSRPTGPLLLRTMSCAERARIIAAVALLSCWTAGEALVPALIGATIDHAIAGGNLTGLILWLIALGLCFAMLSFGYRFGARLGNSGMNRQVHQLRTRIAEHVMAPDYRPRSARMPGEIATITSVDTDVSASVIRQASLGFSALGGLLVCAVYLIWANLWVGLSVLIITPLGMVALRWLTPRLNKASDNLQADIAASGPLPRTSWPVFRCCVALVATIRPPLITVRPANVRPMRELIQLLPRVASTRLRY